MWLSTCTVLAAMLKIRRAEEGVATVILSGQIEEKHVSELQEILNAQTDPEDLTINLAEVRLVDREAIRFFAACEARGIGLTDCPSYIRRWIEQGRYDTSQDV